jgi:hypothetical protein
MSVRRDLLDACLAQGKHQEAARLYLTEVERWRRTLPRMDEQWRAPSSRALARFIRAYAALLRTLGRPRTAHRREAQAAAILAEYDSADPDAATA